MTIMACEATPSTPATSGLFVPKSAPAKPAYRHVRKPAVRRPSLVGLVDDRFKVHCRPASVYLIHDDAGYHVTPGWLGDDIAYRLRDEDTREVATVRGNMGRFRCSCPDAARLPRMRCRHVAAVLSAFEQVGEMPPEPAYGESWETWVDDDRWVATDPTIDLDEIGEPRPTADDSYAPTELEQLEWLGYTLAREGEAANPTRDVDLMPALRSFFHGKFDGELGRELAMAGPRETDGFGPGYCS